MIQISMNSSEKNSKKQFSLSQYYSQLERYQTNLTSSKVNTLKKDNSLSSFSKATSKPSISKTLKQQFNQDKPKLGILDKYASKSSFDKFDYSKLQNLKKHNKGEEERRPKNFQIQSLDTSQINCKKWLNQSHLEEKENINFCPNDQNKFVEHCSNLYNIRDNTGIVESIQKEINKRDKVYDVVSKYFGEEGDQKYEQKLQNYFNEHELMRKIINQFKSISKLETQDLNELYYFLKTDR